MGRILDDGRKQNGIAIENKILYFQLKKIPQPLILLGFKREKKSGDASDIASPIKICYVDFKQIVSNILCDFGHNLRFS